MLNKNAGQIQPHRSFSNKKKCGCVSYALNPDIHALSCLGTEKSMHLTALEQKIYTLSCPKIEKSMFFITLNWRYPSSGVLRIGNTHALRCPESEISML